MKDFVYKKKFGQNFISDKNLLNAIVQDAEILPEDEVLEIGAGAGSLTTILSESAKKVVSFEIDRDLSAVLQKLNLKNVEFVFDDFLKYQMSEIEKKFKKNYKVVANLPYYITTPIIFRLLEDGKKIESLTVMVQKEVALRVCAREGGKDYGVLSVMCQFFGEPKIKRIIGRQMFYPEPNVDSALLNIKIDRNKFEDVDREKFSNFIKVCFAMRRKTLLNNLSQIYTKEFLKNTLDENILALRPESLSVFKFIEIYKLLNK